MAAQPEAVFPPTVSSDRLSALQSAVTGFDREQLIWSSGFLAGLAQSTVVSPVAPTAAADMPAANAWSVYYATETGNSARVAGSLADRARLAGLRVELHDLRDVRPRALAKVERAVFVLATHGVGEPPEGTEAFFDLWFSNAAPRLESLQFGVIALGDSSYPDFCEIGRRFEERLLELGASAVVERVDCDLDFDAVAADWAQTFIDIAAEPASAVAVSPRPPAPTLDVPGREQPFPATVLANQKITGRGSSKDVRHIELDLEGSGLTYQPGDALGVRSTNPPRLVDTVIKQAGLDGRHAVTVQGTEMPLADVLATHKEITQLSRPLLDTVAVDHESLRSIIASRTNLSRYLATRQLTDLLAEFPRDWTAQDFVDVLRGLVPRLYSIASSPAANPDEAHLTVAVVNYEKFGRPHWGTASSFLANTEIAPVFVERNDRFRLPADGDVPIIMIGAGTGVAPYRAFLEHRRELGHRGRNWLIFGDRNRASDFLYQLEWLRYRKDGILTRLDVAFSRDQADKVYVQDRLREQGRELYAWLEEGAHIYVCGDAQRMAPDVDAALAEIIGEYGSTPADRSADYAVELRRAGRYLRDVY